jgi:hypothetical protein
MRSRFVITTVSNLTQLVWGRIKLKRGQSGVKVKLSYKEAAAAACFAHSTIIGPHTAASKSEGSNETAFMTHH